MKVYAGLHIDGPALVPEDATKATGLKPDATYPRDQRLPSGRLRGHGSWCIHAKRSPSRERLEDAVDDLLAVAVPAWAALVDLAARHEARICVVITVEGFDDSYPRIHLRQDQLARLAELRASIDVDDYDERVMLPARARPEEPDKHQRLA